MLRVKQPTVVDACGKAIDDEQPRFSDLRLSKTDLPDSY